jgi:hypothetical protein
MANGRGSRSKVDTGRDAGRFVGLPVSVLESAAYLGLSANARSLLMEVALQCHGDDNGRMLLSRAHLSKRGWSSSDMISKGKRELLDAELIFETVKGQRPNKASWYAVTWRRLDKLYGFDCGVEKAFRRSAYCRTVGNVPPVKNASLTPSHGTEGPRIAPAHGTAITPAVPPNGPIRAVSAPLPVPPHGHPLERPSAGVALRVEGKCGVRTANRERTRIGVMLLRVRPLQRSAGYHSARARLAHD